MNQQLMEGQNDFGAFVGLDWAERKHVFALQDSGSYKIELGEIEHTPETVDAWAMELSQRFGGQPVAVALEQVRGALVFMLTKYEHLVLFPVHPTTLANYRKSFRPSGAKGDPHDAGLLLDLLVRHRERLRCLQPDTPETRTLQFLGQERRKLVEEKLRFTQRLSSHLKLYFPPVLGWFGEISSPIAGRFLERWPTLEQVQRAKPATLQRFFVEHHSRQPERIAQRIEEIRCALPATHDTAVITASSSAALALVRILQQVREAITSYDGQIETLAQQHPDFALFDSFPGAGAALIPRLIAALGTDRTRYRTAHEIQCYSGMAPVIESSGKQRWIHYRRSCPRFLRQTFHEWALHSLASSRWAKSYYEQQRAKGQSHHATVRALAFQWIRILFRCWRDRQLYQEALYEQARQQRATALQADSTTTGYTPVGFGVVDGKSTVIGNLLALLLFNILADHLVGDPAGAHGEIAARPQVPSPKLPAQMSKFLPQDSQTDPFEPRYDWAHVLVRTIRQEQGDVIACSLSGHHLPLDFGHAVDLADGLCGRMPGGVALFRWSITEANKQKRRGRFHVL